MANHTNNDGKVLGMDSNVWGYLRVFTLFGAGVAGALACLLERAGYEGFNAPLGITALLLFVFSNVGSVLALVREEQAENDQKKIQELLSSPNPPTKLAANPKLYRQAQAELQARKEDALKMQQLHALRQQVEDEERKAGIFAPTLSPTGPQSGSNSSQQADPMAAQMAQLAQRRIEAERQKHLMKSLRNVEDTEWEADDV